MSNILTKDELNALLKINTTHNKDAKKLSAVCLPLADEKFFIKNIIESLIKQDFKNILPSLLNKNFNLYESFDIKSCDFCIDDVSFTPSNYLISSFFDKKFLYESYSLVSRKDLSLLEKLLDANQTKDSIESSFFMQNLASDKAYLTLNQIKYWRNFNEVIVNFFDKNINSKLFDDEVKSSLQELSKITDINFKQYLSIKTSILINSHQIEIFYIIPYKALIHLDLEMILNKVDSKNKDNKTLNSLKLNLKLQINLTNINLNQLKNLKADASLDVHPTSTIHLNQKINNAYNLLDEALIRDTTIFNKK